MKIPDSVVRRGIGSFSSNELQFGSFKRFALLNESWRCGTEQTVCPPSGTGSHGKHPRSAVKWSSPTSEEGWRREDRSSEMNASAGTGVFVLSLMSIPISYLFNVLVYSNSIGAILFAGASTLIIITISASLLLNKKAPRDPLFYVYAVYAFLSVVNLIIGLEQDGIIDGFMTFYLKRADPYINTAHGHMVSYWDGCAHYLMYLLMVAAITWGENYRSIGLYWVGSFLMRMIVYIPGNIVGKYGTQISLLFLVHMLYVLVSLWACFRVFSLRRVREDQPLNTEDDQRKSLLQRPVHLMFAIYFILASAFCIFRGLMLVNMLYFVPCYVITLYGLVVPGCEWITDLALVHAGASAQAQFSHIGASLHTRTPFTFRVPSDSQILFLTVNILYGLVPQAFCYYVLNFPTFFLKPSQEKKKE
ncbi:transmembrane 6 superfamily member 1-like isoform X2 [Denticeps clupeoides]|uniref:Transmembrane 6 superfamily member 1 n=1 Tax=Denticeps clupeoides TaxID=299321 RepID=A0AAY4ESI1_9TELE|nr:transmembrane 6 superfamily member 1 isoform X2 [Denticeps clupeoides]